MGSIIKKSEYELIEKNSTSFLVVWCNHSDVIKNRAISIDVELSTKIKYTSKSTRSMKIGSILTEVIAALPENSIIRDFDVLFNPEFRIDVIKTLTEAYRRNHFQIVWPGKIDGDFLVYAEEGYRDYKKFSIDNYDITCIV